MKRRSGTARDRSRIPEWPEAHARRVLAADSSYFDHAFTLVLLVIVGGLLAVTTTYGGDARTVPLLVMVPTFVLLVVLFVTQVLSRFTDAVEDVSKLSAMQNEVEQPSVAASVAADDGDAGVAGHVRLLTVVLWVVLLPVAFYVLGIVVGSLVYLPLFYRYRANRGWRETALYTAVIWTALVVTFGVALETPLYSGIVGSTLTGHLPT